jgi:DNA-directed RNA polymerase specialized sigma24 family protein
VCDEPEAAVCDKTASSIDDAAGSGGAWGGVGPKPWWFDDPELAAARRRVLEEIESAPDRPDYTEPDLVLNDMLSGASVRELGQARDDLACAQSRYSEAIRSARICGLSWGEIGSVLGVPRQLLHRRFARQLGSRRGPIER